ncbi:MAG: ABC transporter permease [Chitinophagaceae bacterium]|nr:MAG: ABC transporter permease [Chitinophagaceae bacterium]
MVWQFASRYLRAKKSTQAINIISWVSISAITIGAAALIIVLSVFNGFENLVKSLYSSFYPEIRISPAEGKTMLVPASKLDSLQKLNEVKSVSKSLQEKALLKYNDEKTIAILKGVDLHFAQVTGISGKIVRGTFNTGNVDTPKAVVGIGIEAALGIDVERSFIPMLIYLPRANVESFVFPEQAFYVGQISPDGTFAIQQDFDNQYVITSLAYMQRLMGMPSNRVSELEVTLNPGTDLKQAKTDISKIFGEKNYLVQTRYEQNRSLYQVMQTEKWFVYAILLFIFAIAAFNMIGCLSMLVIEKRRDITILKAMGARYSLIQRIFLTEGLLIALVGAGAGTILAILICLGQQKYGWVKLGGGTFVVDSYPVNMQYTDFILVWVTILLIALLASWYPSLKASQQPVDLKAE